MPTADIAYSNITANEPYSYDVIVYNSILLLHRRIANYYKVARMSRQQKLLGLIVMVDY